jgi:hypothetical protein
VLGGGAEGGGLSETGRMTGATTRRIRVGDAVAEHVTSLGGGVTHERATGCDVGRYFPFPIVQTIYETSDSPL